MNTSDHPTPTKRVVVEYDGVVPRPSIRVKRDKPSREPEKVGYLVQELPHISLYEAETGDLHWIALPGITDIQLARPTSTEPLWRLCFWHEGEFDDTTYYTSKHSVKRIMEDWLDQ